LTNEEVIYVSKILLKKITLYSLPAIFMATLSIISSSKSAADGKGLIFFSLTSYFPMLFFIQGILCSFFNDSILISLGLSIITFIAIMLIYLNSTALGYIFVYLAFWGIGYGIVFLSRKLSSNK